MFDRNTRATNIAIDIIDNGQYETVEQFLVRLSSSDSRVVLSPSQAAVTIGDDDGMIEVYKFS